MRKRTVTKPGSAPKRQRRTGVQVEDWNVHSDGDASEDDETRPGPDQDDEQADPLEQETAEERRVRIAKEMLAKLKEAEQASGSESESESEDEDSDAGGQGARPHLDAVSRKLHSGLLESEGRLRRPLAASFAEGAMVPQMCSRGHRFPITCIALSEAEDVCFSGSKDCSIIKWDVETGKKIARYAGRPNAPDGFEGHTDQVLAMSLSTDGRYLATGGRDKLVRIWDARSDKLIDTFQGHRDAVSGLAFRRNSHTLYSTSYDRSVRAWNVDEMAFVEALFGHQAEINAIDCLFRERAVTCSTDRSVRFWKIPEESQLVLQGAHRASLDCVKMIDEVHFVTGSQDGCLALWNIGKKKPCAIVRGAHGSSWVSSVASMLNSDVVASGGADGFVKLWRVDLDKRRLESPPVAKLPADGFVNALQFGSSGRILAAGLGREHRLGRWLSDKSGSNRLCFFRLPDVDQPSDGSDAEASEEEASDGTSSG